MIKNYIPFHQFKKIDESIISEMMEAEGTCITFDLPSVEDMVASAEDGYYHDSDCEIYFYLPKYGDEPIVVVFEISFSFDYEIFNENVDIYLQDIIIENYDAEIDLNSDEVKKLENFIEKMLTD